MLEVLGQILVLLGVVVFATAALGLFRFPDAYTRVSGVGTAGGVGVSLVIIGAVLLEPSLTRAVIGVLIIAFQLTTSAVATSAIARSAFLSRSPLSELAFNDLADPSDLHHGRTS